MYKNVLFFFCFVVVVVVVVVVLSSDIVKDKLTSVTVDLQFVQCPDDIDTNLEFYSIIDSVCGPKFRQKC